MIARIDTKVIFSAHAVERFQQRVRPTLAHAQVPAELDRLADFGVLRTEAPSWLKERQRQESPLYLEIGDATFPLVPDETGKCWRALTCIARGGISKFARERRNLDRIAKRKTKERLR